MHVAISARLFTGPRRMPQLGKDIFQIRRYGLNSLSF